MKKKELGIGHWALVRTMKSDVTTRSLLTTTLVGACALGTVSAVVGCRGDRTEQPPHQFFPDLDDAPKWNPQTHSEFFADGRSMRQPPAHAVAFGRHAFVPPGGEVWGASFMQQRADLLKDNPVYYTGREGDAWVVKAPIAFTQADILRGQERFGIFCSVCHGLEGDGQGMVGKNWGTPIPSYHEPKYQRPDMTVTPGHEGHAHPEGEQYKDGYIFNTARNGVPGGAVESPDWVNTKMPGYAHALSVDDTWRIVAYIRVLQQSRRGSIGDVPADQRDGVLQKMKEADDAAAKAAAEAAAAAAAAGAAAPTPAPTGESK